MKGLGQKLPRFIMLLAVFCRRYGETTFTCKKCNPGSYLKACEGSDVSCGPCPNGTYTDEKNHWHQCKQCHSTCFDEENSIEMSSCTTSTDIQCECRPGYYNDGGRSTCYPHSPCDPGYGVTEHAVMNSRCDPCEEGTFSSRLDFERCTALTNCSQLGMVLAKPGDNMTDNVCQPKPCEVCPACKKCEIQRPLQDGSCHCGMELDKGVGLAIVLIISFFLLAAIMIIAQLYYWGSKRHGPQYDGTDRTSILEMLTKNPSSACCVFVRAVTSGQSVRKILDDKRDYLTENIEIQNLLYDKLIRCEVLKDNAVDRIQTNDGRVKEIGELLNDIKKRPWLDFFKFLLCLEEDGQGHIVEALFPNKPSLHETTVKVESDDDTAGSPLLKD